MNLLCLLMLAGVTCGSNIRKLHQIPEPGVNAGPTPPCQAERESAGPNDLLPECEYGHYLPKQCNRDSTVCWCVSRCGDVLLETKGGPELVCEEADPPCQTALGESKARGVLFGKFKPKCHEDGFYDHTQCLGTICWCTDRCGNRMENSKHYLWNRRFCACPNNDQAWKCKSNPCDDVEASACPAHPDAVCRPFICGGCSYKFYVDQREVDCAISEPEVGPEPEVEPEPEPETEPEPEQGPIGLVDEASCTDRDGNVRQDGERWKEGRCANCRCNSGFRACITPKCAGRPAGKDCKVRAGTEENCCPQYNCVDEPLIVSTCTDWNGTVRENGESWKEGRCMNCFCSGGGKACVSPMCMGPPARQECRVRPGTEDDCCHKYDCEGCVDTMGNHYIVGETWGDPCNRCECKGDQDAFCKTEVCIGLNPGITPPCHWVIQPDECCPRDNGPGGTVCDEPISVCPPGSSVVSECPTHLCLEATCPSHPDAMCMISRCGACHTVFYLEGYKVECGNDPISIEPVCPEPVPMCVMSPCPSEACTYHPQAVCYTDYCDPCQAVFYDENDRPLICGDPLNMLVQCKDSANTKHAVGDMWEEGCNECTCEASGIPKCTAKKCAIDRNRLLPLCEVVYGEVDKCCPARMVCYEAISECPSTLMVAPSCPDDLCVSATCETHPEAKCRISRCGGCSTKFFDENKRPIEECTGQSVDLRTVCANVGPVTMCVAPPCLYGTCALNPDLTCHADVCQPCTPLYHDENNNLQSCTLVSEECMDSSNTNMYAVDETWEEDCNVCTCMGNGMATCIAKKCAIDGSHLPPMCEVVYGEGDKCCPARMVCYEAISECPSTLMVAPSCPDDLCVSATCETHPEAKCRISRCGGCSAKFFDESKQPIEECTGKLVDLRTVCANVGPVTMCVAPPCLYGTCAFNPGLTCHADVCEPCTPLFHDDNNNLQSCTPGTANVCNSAVKILTPRGTRTHPRCRWDGKFSPKQCDSMGYCWCVEADGSMADTQDHSQTGHEIICGFSLPCQYEVKINKVKKERGKTVTFNPTCLTNGFYDTVQCNAEECWCSEKDGTVVIGSTKPQGEPLKCSSVCLGDAARTIPDTFCTRTYDKCPSNTFCHIPTNRSSGRCCHL